MLRAVAASKPTAVYTLAQSAIPASCPADTTEDTLATITIPAGVMGPNSSVRIDVTWTVTSSANSKTLNVRFGGVLVANATLTTSTSMRHQVLVSNRNATNSQLAQAASGSSFVNFSGANLVAAIDTTASVSITITGQKALNTETITLERYVVEVLP